MGKMLHLLLDWEYPHWMMMAGAIIVALGFMGFAGLIKCPLLARLRHAAPYDENVGFQG
jgi:hypothetical protein